MVNRRWIVTHLIGWLVAAVVPLCASAAEIRLTVSVPHPDADSGVATNQLRLGMLPAASDNFDPSLDLEAFPAPGLTAAVRHTEYPSAQQLLWWDLRAVEFPKVWEVEVSSDRSNASISLSAAAPATVPNECPGGRWALRDVQTNQTTEFGASATVYTYPNTPGVIRRFVVTAAEGLATPPAPPLNLWSPRQGRASVYLAWSSTAGSGLRHHVYREAGQGPVRLTATPIASTSYLDTGVDRTNPVTYRVTAVDESACESGFSAALTVVPHR